MKTRRPTTTAKRRVRAAPKVSRAGGRSANKLQLQLEGKTRALNEALEQQRATSEVLRVISSSPGDLETVFRTILQSATRLCAAKFGTLWLREGDAFRAVAMHDVPRAFAKQRRSEPLVRPSHPDSALARLLKTKRTVEFVDLATAKAYVDRDPVFTALVELGKVNTLLAVPMLKDNEVIGAIGIYRKEVRPFARSQIELVTNFAAQAVIAIENSRLLNGLRDSLQQQTATADVLKVISRSAFDLQAVLDTLVQSAARLCDADSAFIFRREAQTYHLAASHGFSEQFVQLVADHPMAPGRGTLIGRVAFEGRTAHIPDVLADPDYTWTKAVRSGEFRTMLGVPLLREGAPIGVIAMSRRIVRPFSSSQIELLTTFADQAVIAIENVRLFEAEQQRTRELRESLQQQTATAGVLEVISRSAFDLQQVFETVAESSVRLCGADKAFIFRYDGELLRAAASFNASPKLAEFVARNPIRPGRHSGTARAALERRTIHIPDVLVDPEYSYGAKNIDPVRTVLGVPILKGDDLLGVIMIYRLDEVRPFTDNQIALVETFADQAAIAIENVRLFEAEQQRTRDLAEALQQQTATADVLKVISRSTFDLRTVLDTLVESAARLCEADGAAITQPKDGVLQFAASFGFPPEFIEVAKRTRFVRGRGTVTGRVLIEGKPVQIDDVLADREYDFVEGQKTSGFRTSLGVPLLREGETIGVMALIRSQVSPFTNKQIELVTTFADQAVIAIENVRLFEAEQQRTRELSESLQQQTATADVLKVISRSAFDLQTVLDTLVKSAALLCEAESATIHRPKDGAYHFVASYGFVEEYVAYLRDHPIVPARGSVLGRVVLDRKTVHVADVHSDPDYKLIEQRKVGGYRTVLGVPLMREGEPIGAIMLTHATVRPFTDKQIELVTTFADQAVIAIENVRLFEAEQQRTRELSEALEQQTATSEVLRVISSSPGELEPVFQAMLGNATKLCQASFGAMWLCEGDAFRVAARNGGDPLPAVFTEKWRSGTVVHLSPNVPIARVRQTGRPLQIADLREDQSYLAREPLPVSAVDVAGARTLIVIPMRKENEVVGIIAIFRQEVRPFSDKQIELVTNFAAQAVIAIENTRLLNELRQRTDDLSEALERQTATSEVLQVISRSPGELEPVFAAMLSNATRICEAKFGTLYLREGDAFRAAALHNAPPELAAVRKRGPVQAAPTTALGRMMATKQVVHIPDIKADRAYVERNPLMVSAVELGGFRTLLCVPMLKENEVLGAINIYRQEVQPFTEKQIELLSNFAAQAVIAIENTRLLNELRQRTNDLSEALEQQTATAEVLKVISSSPGELGPVFNSMLENAVRICEASFGNLLLYNGSVFRHVALHNAPQAWAAEQQRDPVPPRQAARVLYRVAATKQVTHIADMAAENPDEPIAIIAGARTVLIVPMVKEDALIGVIAIYRQEVRPFTEKQIALVMSFASQAVIAIENTRLLNELRQSLQRQTATADVLKIISRSTFDLKTVLNTLVESAAKLCDADMAAIPRQVGGIFDHVASYGYSEEYAEFLQRNPIAAGRGTVTGRAVLEGKTIHVPDVLEDPEYSFLEGQKAGGYRTLLGIPLMREGVAIGVLAMGRVSPRPFTPQQIELVTTFADQAVIAIENVRLFESVEARTRELAKSLEDLRTAQDRLIQTEKLASLGQLTAGIAHEIKNPLNFVNNFSSISVELIDELREALDDAQLDGKLRSEIGEIANMLQGNLDKVVQHGKRADSIVKNMLLHSRQGSGEHRPVDINAIVEESLNLAYHGARAEKQGFNITLERSFDPAAGEVDLFPQEITRVLLNLISNGFYAATKRKAETNGGYEPTLSAGTRSLGDRVEIRIRDNGLGIPAEVREKLFNPFFTTKPAGEGTGLGLSISYDIVVKQHAGSIDIDTKPGEFTEFRIVLPRGAATIAKSGENA